MKNKLILIATLVFTVLFSFSLFSCSAIDSAVTKREIETVPVQRPEGVPFNVAKRDVINAELNPGKTYGLYDAGKLAKIVGNSSK